MNAPRHAALPPGSTIGIFGGGQLGRMLALAAARLGYRCHIYAPEDDQPAAQVAEASTRAGYDDLKALDAFAKSIDVATYEFENIPAEPIQRVGAHVPVHPHAEVLRITQDRLFEKDFIRNSGGGTADYVSVSSPADLEAAIAKIGLPAVLKTRRLGYDGKGQVILRQGDDLGAAYGRLAPSDCILEAFVPFSIEISVVVARALDGTTAAYVPVENRHKNHILDVTLAPAEISEELSKSAEALACKLADALDHVGVLAVEMFVTKDGRVLVNELAPRVHNSGHWTIDACSVSQFEQHIRAICGLPLGNPARHANAVMQNLIGNDMDRWPELLAEPGLHLHHYGKSESRPGRKVGHVTKLFPLDTPPTAGV